MAHVTETGEYFLNKLRDLAQKHPSITNVRGIGMMLAVEVDSPDLGKLAVTEMLKKRFVINCTSDTVLRFLPPYIFERKHVDQTIAALDQFLTENAATACTAATKGGTAHG